MRRVPVGVRGQVQGAPRAERRKAWLAILNQVPLAERSPAGAGPAASAPEAGRGPAMRKLSAEELAAGVRRSGWPCATGVKSALKGQIQGPQGPFTTWVLEGSDGQEYTGMVDPRGSTTSFPTPK